MTTIGKIQEQKLPDLLREIGAPGYIDVPKAVAMLDLMRGGQIHPRNRCGDYTLEVAVGVPIPSALRAHADCYSSPSIYASLYESVFGEPLFTPIHLR